MHRHHSVLPPPTLATPREHGSVAPVHAHTHTASVPSRLRDPVDIAAENATLRQRNAELEEKIRTVLRDTADGDREAVVLENEVLSLRSENQKLRSTIETWLRDSGDMSITCLLDVYKAQVETSMAKIQSLQQHIRSLDAECRALDTENSELSERLQMAAAATAANTMLPAPLPPVLPSSLSPPHQHHAGHHPHAAALGAPPEASVSPAAYVRRGVASGGGGGIHSPYPPLQAARLPPERHWVFGL